MIVRTCIGLLGIFALLFSSACTTVDNSARQSSQKRTFGQRAERLAKSVTNTMTDATSDVLPILSVTLNEIVREAKSDLPKITEELRTQLNRTSSPTKP